MVINNPAVINYLYASTGEKLKMKVVDIGDWEMDTDNTVSIAHGIADPSKIKSITGWIRPDSNAANPTRRYPIDIEYVGTATVWLHYIDSTNMVLFREPGGFFDSVAFDQTSYNRGWLLIIYEE